MFYEAAAYRRKRKIAIQSKFAVTVDAASAVAGRPHSNRFPLEVVALRNAAKVCSHETHDPEDVPQQVTFARTPEL